MWCTVTKISVIEPYFFEEGCQTISQFTMLSVDAEKFPDLRNSEKSFNAQEDVVPAGWVTA